MIAKGNGCPVRIRLDASDREENGEAGFSARSCPSGCRKAYCIEIYTQLNGLQQAGSHGILGQVLNNTRYSRSGNLFYIALLYAQKLFSSAPH